MDLFDNPMVSQARKGLTPDQLDDYKRMGEYMYNNTDYSTLTVGSKVEEPGDAELVAYASEALKAGGDPFDLTEKELSALIDAYGETWYIKFSLEKHEVPKPKTFLVTPEQIFKDAQEKAIKVKMSRQQRRKLEKKMAKDRAGMRQDKTK